MQSIKNTITVLASAVLLSVSLPVKANDTLAVRESSVVTIAEIKPVAGKPSLILNGYNVSNAKFQVSLITPEGETINRAYTLISFAQSFNFSAAPEGSYVITVRCGDYLLKKKFRVEYRTGEEAVLIFE